jgi:hypothetical protein
MRFVAKEISPNTYVNLMDSTAHAAMPINIPLSTAALPAMTIKRHLPPGMKA